MNDKKEQVIEKASYYASREIEIHLTLDGGKFYNGLIVDVNDFRIILLDKKLGEVYVPLDEIIDLEPFKEVGKWNLQWMK